MSWGLELWDQFDNLSFHTQKGIDFLERYAHFVRDRCAIETDYATKLRRLVKHYQPKKKEDEDFQYTSCVAFKKMMAEITDLAGQREVIAENLQSDVIKEVGFLVKDIKDERKKCLNEGQRCMDSLSSQGGSLQRARKNYEKAFKEAERATESYQKADADLNLSRAEVEKQRMNMSIKNQHCDEAKSEYANQLQKTNELQRQHYFILMPDIFRQLQELDEKRIRNMKHFMIHTVEVERKVFPIINQCLDGIISAANQIDEKQDTSMVIERYKSGFQPPEDIPFEDLNNRDISGLGSNGGLVGVGLESANGSPKGSNSVLNNGTSYKAPDLRTIKGTISASGTKNKKRGVLGYIFNSNKNNIPLSSLYHHVAGEKDELGDLPPNQRRKKLQQRIEEINTKIQQETATRDGLMKMKGVYEQNPALGDPMTIEGQLNESGHRLDKFRTELQKYHTLLDDLVIDSTSPAICRKPSTISSSPYNICVNGTSANKSSNGGSRKLNDSSSRRNSDQSLSRSTSDSSMTHAHSYQQQPPLPPPPPDMRNLDHCQQNSEESVEYDGGRSSSQASLTDSVLPPPAPPMEPMDDYYEPIPALGTCTALYPFEATSEGSIPMYEGEQLLIIEVDQGDGWTRVRRHNDLEEGFVPTSYIQTTTYDNC